MRLHEQIIEELKQNKEARDDINRIKYGEARFIIQDGILLRWKAENGGNSKINKRKKKQD